MSLKVPTMSEMMANGQSPEILFWVGCAGSFDDRAKKITKALVKILNHCKVNFAVLGAEESCTGDPAKRAGNELLFQVQAMQNISTLNAYNIKKIVTACPHCFNTLKNEYPNLGGSYEVQHHTELLQDLIAAGKVRLKDGGTFQGKRITFHDPCYLGRHNQIYQPPRELLESTGVEVTEMPRNQDRSFCCGAGGGRMWMEETIGTRINLNRVDEAIATQVKEVAVACPFCRIMVSDGMTARESDIGVLDVAQVLLRNIKG
jgi:Fe-S oxidoreductase